MLCMMCIMGIRHSCTKCGEGASLPGCEPSTFQPYITRLSTRMKETVLMTLATHFMYGYMVLDII